MDALRHHLEWSRTPELVLTDPRSGRVPEWLEGLLEPKLWDLAALAEMYRQAERRAHRQENPRLRIRALLAEASIEYERTGATPAEPLYHVAMQHRLSRSPVAAHCWASTLLGRGDVTPLYQARLWRELAALQEVAGSYEQGLASIERSLAVCALHPHDGLLQTAASQSHLQRSTLLRLSGRYAEARAAISDAREAAGSSPSPQTLALLALRTAGLDLVIGHLDEAERGYEEAARLFKGVSPNNRRYALLRQVTCLRGQGQLGAAADLGTRLLDEVTGDPYRTGQVLLELAEIEMERRHETALTRILERAAPLLSGGDSLESLRWRTLFARSAVVFDHTDPVRLQQARTALAEVLAIAGRPERRDVTRLLIALHTLAELCSIAGGEPSQLSLLATRSAVIAAELQRTAMTTAEDRWQMKRTREAVYALAALLHSQHGRHADVATVLELGKADLIEQALGNSALSLVAASLASTSPAGAQQTLSEALTSLTDALSGAGLQATAMPPLPGSAPFSAGFDQYLSIGLINDEGVWKAVRALGSRNGAWTSSTVTASPRGSALLTRLIQAPSPDVRGVSNQTWRELGDLLLPEELVDGASGSLLVSPDPRLWCLPWPALPFQGAYLVDLGPLTLTPSLQSHSALHCRTPTAPPDPQTHPGHLDDTLCGSELEREALRQWNQSLEPRPGLLYVTGHAASPESELGPAKLDFDSLSRGSLPEIVVLNGCWTGVTRPVYGRDPFSLGVGALIGGARYAIAGSGHIGSEASAHVGVDLLRRLSDGHDVASALRLAQVTVRENHPETGPMDWGGLVAVG